jgi:hypothetical protein
MQTANTQKTVNPVRARLVDEVWERVGRFLCGLTGHNLLRHFDNGRMCLQCLDCGHETPGWAGK